MLSLVVHMVIHLLNTHLTISNIAFSLMLNTIPFEYSTLEWFENSTCIAFSVDLLPSFIQLFVSSTSLRYLEVRSWRTGAEPFKEIYSPISLNFLYLLSTNSLKSNFFKLFTLETISFFKASATASTSF